MHISCYKCLIVELSAAKICYKRSQIDLNKVKTKLQLFMTICLERFGFEGFMSHEFDGSFVIATGDLGNIFRQSNENSHDLFITIITLYHI